MKTKKNAKEPEIVAATAEDDWFFIKFRQGKQEWIEGRPYSLELYKELIPFLGYA